MIEMWVPDRFARWVSRMIFYHLYRWRIQRMEQQCDIKVRYFNTNRVRERADYFAGQRDILKELLREYNC